MASGPSDTYGGNRSGKYPLVVTKISDVFPTPLPPTNVIFKGGGAAVLDTMAPIGKKGKPCLETQEADAVAGTVWIPASPGSLLNARDLIKREIMG